MPDSLHGDTRCVSGRLKVSCCSSADLRKVCLEGTYMCRRGKEPCGSAICSAKAAGRPLRPAGDLLARARIPETVLLAVVVWSAPQPKLQIACRQAISSAIGS